MVESSGNKDCECGGKCSCGLYAGDCTCPNGCRCKCKCGNRRDAENKDKASNEGDGDVDTSDEG